VTTDDGGGERAGAAATGAGDRTGDDADGEPAAETGTSDGIDRRGWALVAALATALLVVPGTIYLFPALPAEAGLPFFAAMLVLPLAPAVLLGLVAVWSMTYDGE
jgi:hypothetical protein